MWSIIRNLNLMKTATVEGEADMETVSYAFSLLCLILYVGGVKWRMSSGVDVENERAEWMWRISDEDIYLRLAKKTTYMCFCFVLI